MTLFNHLIQEHILLLQLKGYDERTLDSPEVEGTLFKHLEIEITKAINSTIENYNSTTFILKATGRFSNFPDPIDIHLTYKYEPDKIAISIEQIQLRSNYTKAEIRLSNSYALPHSYEIVRALKIEIALKRRRINVRKSNGNRI
ncbi:hypothetical protein QFZ51_003515 [Chitinophaga sp. W3I9]|uniref:hypothetical protein n=1 Tax=Chitinophaga sp. W3I9 TaxID=3373924 RepID=UPI003D2472D2